MSHDAVTNESSDLRIRSHTLLESHSFRRETLTTQARENKDDVDSYIAVLPCDACGI